MLNSKVVISQLKKNPSEYLWIICQNNPKAVQDRLKRFYNMTYNYQDTEGMMDGFQQLIENDPSHSAGILYNVFGVDILGAGLEDVGLDVVLDAIDTSQKSGNKMLKSSGGPFDFDSDDPFGFGSVNTDFQGPSSEGTDGEAQTNSDIEDSGFNWNGILNVFGESILEDLLPNQSNNNGSNNNQQQKSTPVQTWIFIAVILILLVVLLWAIFKKN